MTIDKNFYLDLPQQILEFTKLLERGDKYCFNLTKNSNNRQGELISLGFSCYALKVFYMTNEWSNLSNQDKDKWINFINSFQVDTLEFPKYSYVDPFFLKAYSNLPISEEIKFQLKSIVNFTSLKKYDTKSTKIQRSINAETKQAISSLYQVGSRNKQLISLPYKDEKQLKSYLYSLDWSQPWSAGAQLSSICVYNATQDLNLDNVLNSFINKLSNNKTGSYYLKTPKTSREIINGAMKIITGLDWLNEGIHYPEKLIDFCLDNKPILEGCDVVDFVYVLYMCGKQTSYRKKEINSLFNDILLKLNSLYNKEDNAFSYFVGKAQTHYYGIEVTNGANVADLHGSTLCLWAILMILESLEMNDKNYKIIKP